MSEEPDNSVIRVLHVVDRLARGGAEAWLHAVAQHIDRQRFAIDVLVHTDEPQPYDQAMRDLGCRVLPCLRPSRPWRYAREFQRIVREHGPYDIVHCHTHFWNGVVLYLAARAGVPVRIAHSQNANTIQEQRRSPVRAAYRHTMRHLIHRHATLGLALSRAAAAALYGSRWHNDPRWQMLYSAIDLSAFEDPDPPDELPPALRDHPGPVVVNIGRFHPQKNHGFLLNVFEAMARRDPRVHFALVGSGELEASIRALVERSDVLRGRITFLGDRADVPSLLCHRFDLLMLPSLWEGLGRVAVEAQAAGVPALLSRAVPAEAAPVPELAHFLGLDDPPEAWAERAAALLAERPPLTRGAAIARLRETEFAIERNVERLQAIYEQSVAEARARTRSKK